MPFSNPITRTLALAAVLTSGAAQAQVVMYTNEAAFQAALSQVGYDFFSDLSPGAQGANIIGRLTRDGGALLGYGVSASGSQSTNELWVAGTQTDHWISTAAADATLTLYAFTPGVTAVGLYGIASDVNGGPAPGFLMSVKACPLDTSVDCVSDTYNSTIGDSDFRGFISLSGFRYVSAYSPDSSGAFPAISEVQIGVAVPEPGTYALMLAGLAGVGLVARRRRAG